MAHGDSEFSRLLEDEPEVFPATPDEHLLRRRHTGINPEAGEKTHLSELPNQAINQPFTWNTPSPPVAIFVVSFDVKLGNVMAWSASKKDINLSGLELKAFPSGAHLIPTDFTVFKYHEYYGIACFETVKDDTSARGAHLKCVGILADSLDGVTRHRIFLAQQVKRLHKRPDYCDDLQRWFDGVASKDVLDTSGEFYRDDELLVFPDRNQVLAFLRSMDVQLFTLWRLVMLRKRILFLGGPPVEMLCAQVSLCSLLDSSEENSSGSSCKASTWFFVDLHDMDRLKLAQTFIACSTEKIFETKPELYDAIIHNGEVRIPNDILRNEICRTSAGDKDRFSQLLGLISVDPRCHDENHNPSDPTSSKSHLLMAEFFATLNDGILTSLRSVASFGSGKISEEDISNMSLDPWTDIPFLKAYAELRGMHLEFPAAIWCPTCRCC